MKLDHLNKYILLKYMKKYLIKSIFVGDILVGKTCLLNRFYNNSYNEYSPTTIGIDFMSRTQIINNNEIKLQLWDTGGQERYRAFTKSYFRHIYLFFLVFNLTDIASFYNLEYWVTQINEYSLRGDIKIILIGNYSDKKDNITVSKNQINIFTNRHNLEYYEVSAKTGYNVKYMFNTVFENIVKNINNIQLGEGISEYHEKYVTFKDQRNKNKLKCC